MDFEFVHNDERLTVRAEVGKNSIRVVDGDSEISYDFFSADGSLFTISANGKATRVVAVKDGETIYVSTPGGDFQFRLPPSVDGDTFSEAGGGSGDKSKLVAPMPGKVVKVLVEEGQAVTEKEKLVIVEAMKMENPLVAPYPAQVVKINCEEGQLVDTEIILVELKELEN